MKKSVFLFVMALSLSYFNSNSQTIIFEENFDDYTSGTKFVEQSIQAGDSCWMTNDYNPGGNFDPVVTNTNSSSGNNSIHFTNVEYIHLDMGIKTTGVYSIKYKCWITQDTSFFFLDIYSQKKESDINPGNHGLKQFITSPIVTAFMASGEYINTDYGDFPSEQWIEYEYIVNLNQDSVTVIINNDNKGTYKWSGGAVNNNPYPLKSLESISFYSMEAPYVTDFYIDDIVITEIISPANLFLDPNLLTFNIEQNQTEDIELTIQNNGGSELGYELALSYNWENASIPTKSINEAGVLSYNQSEFYEKIGRGVYLDTTIIFLYSILSPNTIRSISL